METGVGTPRRHETLVSDTAAPIKEADMTTSTATRRRQTEVPKPLTSPGLAVGVLVLTAVLCLGALLGPNLVADELGMTMTMSMTHYMELLAVHQPRNLLVFMALPVVLAETLAITELAILFRRGDVPTWVRKTSRVAGLLAGPIMLAIFLHLMLNAVVPLTLAGGWRGPADVVAVGFYLSGVVPLVGITLVELGVIGRDAASALKWHATFIAIFLVVAHIAMIFGMLDPAVLGYRMLHQH
ncbi:MAG TPA: DUF6803 family protein [Propionicimonas sp.]|nr:DUF6803 family protein [Propionicimonas sp.]